MLQTSSSPSLTCPAALGRPFSSSVQICSDHAKAGFRQLATCDDKWPKGLVQVHPKDFKSSISRQSQNAKSLLYGESLSLSLARSLARSSDMLTQFHKLAQTMHEDAEARTVARMLRASLRDVLLTVTACT